MEQTRLVSREEGGRSTGAAMTAHSRYTKAALVLRVPSGVAPMVAAERCLEARVGFA